MLSLVGIVFFFLTASVQLKSATGLTAGVAYGRLGNNLPSHDRVVSLLKANNIENAMIYDTDSEVLDAFMDSGINLIVQAPNYQLPSLASSAEEANLWVQTNILPYSSIIRAIAIGNEVLTANPESAHCLFPAMINVYNALCRQNLQESIKVSTPHAADVLDSRSFPPSQGRFRSSIMEQMRPILQFLSQTGAPFMANVYPFFAYIAANDEIELPYALFEPTRGVRDSLTGIEYSNLFDAQVDTLKAAMKSLSHDEIPIVVTETGWPSNGHPSATVENARTYVTNLQAHLLCATPENSSLPADTYIFALFNENQKTGPDYERHFGLFNPDESKIY